MVAPPPLLPREVIAADEVDEALSALHLEVASLEEELDRAVFRAEELESRLANEGGSPASYDRALEQLLAFLDEHEAASDRTFAAELREARVTASEMVDEARADAWAVVAEGRQALGRAALASLRAQPMPVLAPPGAEPVIGLVENRAPEVALPSTDPFADAIAQTVAKVAARVISEPLVLRQPDDSVVAEPEAQPIEELTIVSPELPPVEQVETFEAQIAETEASVAEAPLELEETAAAVKDDLEVAVEPAADFYGEFWEEAESAAKPRGLRAIPLEAVLPMIALLIVLVVVLAWVG